MQVVNTMPSKFTKSADNYNIADIEEGGLILYKSKMRGGDK